MTCFMAANQIRLAILMLIFLRSMQWRVIDLLRAPSSDASTTNRASEMFQGPSWAEAYLFVGCKHFPVPPLLPRDARYFQ